MTAVPAAAGAPKMTVPLWTRGDLNAFFGLGINMLVNVLVLAGLSAGVVQIPGHDVFQVILPALGIELLVGNCFYFYLARRLAEKEGRTDVTAMPYGPSVPHMFIVTFVVMLPTFIATKDPIKAWTAGLAWAFIIGVIILIGAFVGPTIRKYTPRAALLGTLAGISITFISMRPAAQMWEAAWIALPVLALIIIGFVSGVSLPGNFPIGLAALLLGSAIAWAGGFMETAAVTTAAKDIAVGIPSLNLGKLFDGLSGISPLLATAIPLGIYNFTEAMSNVESAAAAGDKYNLRQVLLADGTGAIIGSALGSPFPPAVYVGHPGWKAAGGRVSYSLATGIVIFLLCVFGMFPLLGAILPVPAIVPVLLFIGLVIGSQAFRAVPRAHYAAIVLAVVPNVAAWASGLIDNSLAAAGTNAGKVGLAALGANGVVYEGLLKLGEGAVLAGMLLGAIAVFMIDRRFVWAAGYSFLGAALATVGLIHGAKVSLDFESIQLKLALGYALMGVVCLVFSRMGIAEREVDLSDPVDVEDYAERMAYKTADVPEEKTPALQPA
ncbi:MAG: adenine/guanine/hypoxanthine permease [Solirubrobacteraceae bacterium]|jgi:AGZA family xanthine/uracil permease-like MFS transporter|nr:adenine/guanine/hypoxanthine permease [Solirubrobacteraceae bacterium]